MYVYTGTAVANIMSIVFFQMIFVSPQFTVRFVVAIAAVDGTKLVRLCSWRSLSLSLTIAGFWLQAALFEASASIF